MAEMITEKSIKEERGKNVTIMLIKYIETAISKRNSKTNI